MYSKRIKIFVIISSCLLLICILRLIQMQLWSDSYYRERIAELKLQRSRIEPLRTIRGKILDRNGEILAYDKPQFQLYVDYTLVSIADERIQKAQILRASARDIKATNKVGTGFFKLFRRGIIMNVTNPKVAIFFLAFLPQFTDPNRGSVALQLITLGLIFIIAVIIVFGSIAFLAGIFG